jgi:hypothetical protein
MAPASAEQRLAARLAAPFTRPGQSKAPLSFRLLPEGGMVVISANGRKLWFTLDEVNSARAELGLPEVKPPLKPEKLKEEKPVKHSDFSAPSAPRTRDGQSEMLVLPPDLKHLEQEINAKIRRP